MKRNEGQALVEFIIILPISIILVFCVIDFGRIISLKGTLENITSDAVTLYENGSTKEEIETLVNKNKNDKIKIDIIYDGTYTTITAEKELKPITPGLTYISKDVFDVKASRVIKNE